MLTHSCSKKDALEDNECAILANDVDDIYARMRRSARDQRVTLTNFVISRHVGFNVMIASALYVNFSLL